MGRYLSNELFHFVGHTHPTDNDRNYAILGAILADGCVSHPPHVRGWGETSVRSNFEGSLLRDELVVPTVTCFCDIPAEHLDVHLSKYGSFGLSFDVGFLARFGARPVLYVPLRGDNVGSPFGSVLLRNVEAVYRGFHRNFMRNNRIPPHRVRALGSIPTSSESAAREMHNVFVKDFLAFLKPFNSELPEEHPDYYYSEREWRKYGNVMFQPEDVRRLLIAPGFETRLADEYPKYASKIEVYRRPT